MDSQLLNDAYMMTAVGFGTAIAMLILLMVVILVGGRLLKALEARSAGRAGSDEAPPSDGPARDKALAAVVAVTAVLAERRPESTIDAP